MVQSSSTGHDVIISRQALKRLLITPLDRVIKFGIIHIQYKQIINLRSIYESKTLR